MQAKKVILFWKDKNVANNNKWRIIGIVISLIVIATGMVATFAVGQDDIKDLGEDVAVLEVKIEKNATKANENENTIIAIGKDIEYIKKGIDDIKGKLP